MLRLQDWILLAVCFSSILLGILAPQACSVFQPLPVYSMMVLLFLSFLSIRLIAVWETLRCTFFRILYCTFIKLIVLPVIVFFLFRWIMPEYALGAMLLSGMSCGVVSPFFALILRANAPLVLVLVVVTSLIVPLSLPALVTVLIGHSLEISFSAMMRLLFLVVFIPLLIAESLGFLAPVIVEAIRRKQYSFSLALFAVTNMGIFSKYADYFHQHPAVVLVAMLVAAILAAIYFVLGILFSRRMSVADQLAVVISFGIMNNVLVMVFASQFFGPVEPTLAAMYTVPFFGLLVPLRLLQGYLQSRSVSEAATDAQTLGSSSRHWK